MRRRPIQRTAKDEYIEIGDQLSGDRIPEGTFQGLQDDAKLLQADLSGTKDKVRPREEETELMQKGTYFLHRFLNAVDGSKMKKAR